MSLTIRAMSQHPVQESNLHVSNYSFNWFVAKRAYPVHLRGILEPLTGLNREYSLWGEGCQEYYYSRPALRRHLLVVPSVRASAAL